MRGIAQPQLVEFGLKRIPLFCLELKLGLEGGGGLFPGVVRDPPYMDTNIGFNHADCGLHRRRRWAEPARSTNMILTGTPAALAASVSAATRARSAARAATAVGSARVMW